MILSNLQKTIARRAVTPCAIALLMLPCPLAISSEPAATTGEPEPSIEVARSWWSDPLNVWTPLGWKDHLFRYNVLYNGALLCEPATPPQGPKDNTKKYEGQNFQLTFFPSSDGNVPPLPERDIYLYKMDTGRGIQSWRKDKETPVLCTEYPCQEGVVLHEEVFAHMKGGKEVETATEPLYAWVRLSVSHVDEIHAPEKFGFAIQLSKIYYKLHWVMRQENWIIPEARPKEGKLSGGLTQEMIEGSDGKGMSVLESNGKVRMQVLPTGSSLTFKETGKDSGIYSLFVELPMKEGAHVDLVVPMLAESKEEIDGETALGYEGALAQCEQYWNRKPETAARIHTPEDYVNQAIRRDLQLCQIVAEKSPETGLYTFLTGSYGYDVLWSTPTSMRSHMFFDLLGYHDVVARHIQIYKAEQGTVKPPGPNYKMHPGYLSTPKNLTSIDWLADHGAILEIISRHALMTGDPKFIEEWLPTILKGCEFIRDSCAMTNHNGIKGILPPAVATDSATPLQATWTESWNYKGFDTAVRLLGKINHPRAEEFRKVARDYQVAFEKAFRECADREPKWTDAQGKQHPKPAFILNTIAETRHHFFDEPSTLDCGPMSLGWAGLLDSADPLMQSYLEYFREGPNTKLRGPRSGPMDRPVLVHEMSSWEPCYSWNVINSWRTGDREKFLEGMYSLFTGALSPQTFVAGEVRNGMYGDLGTPPLVTWCMRQSVIDDQLKDGEIHLLRLCPLAWIKNDEETVFDNMPTMNGPVDLRFKLSDDEKSLVVTFKPRWRIAPKKVVLHVPPVKGLTSVVVNGTRHRATAGEIEL